MQVTIFDGTNTSPCSLQEAQAAANQPGISWIDIRLEAGDNPTDLLTAVGLDAASVTTALDQGLGSNFDVSDVAIQGSCWLDDNDGSPVGQGYFAWNSMRLVTVRTAGDAAIVVVRQKLSERASLLRSDPSTLPGVVLQLMLATVQQGLTKTLINIGSLDMEIIATPSPQKAQAQALAAYRQSLQGIASRFPMYSVNVQTALIDPAPVAGLDTAGQGQLQQFLSSVQATSGLISGTADAVKSTAQDLQAQVSAWQGNRINVLTIVTMIFLPITFITGYFGMNFQWLENQLNSYVSWLLLAVCMPIGLVIGSTALLVRGGYSVPSLLRRKGHKESRSTSA